MNSEEILELPPPPADARISYGDDPLQFGDLRLPPGPGPHPLVIVIHGGFWRARYDLAYFGHCCADLAQRSVATWNIEYRRIGNPGGAWPGTFQDVARAADFVRVLAQRFPLDITRLVAMGHSAGGHLALWLAGRGRLPATSEVAVGDPIGLRAAVALAPVADLRQVWDRQLGSGVVGDLMGGGPEAFPERYRQGSPADLLPLGVRQVVIHGQLDADAPFDMSVSYVQRAQAAGDSAELVDLGDTGHFEVVDPRTLEWQRVAEVLVRELGAKN